MIHIAFSGCMSVNGTSEICYFSKQRSQKFYFDESAYGVAVVVVVVVVVAQEVEEIEAAGIEVVVV